MTRQQSNIAASPLAVSFYKLLPFVIGFVGFEMHRGNQLTEHGVQIKHIRDDQKVVQAQQRDIVSAVDKLTVKVENHAAECLRAQVGIRK